VILISEIEAAYVSLVFGKASGRSRERENFLSPFLPLLIVEFGFGVHLEWLSRI
jgi:hypothetical protein